MDTLVILYAKIAKYQNNVKNVRIVWIVLFKAASYVRKAILFIIRGVNSFLAMIYVLHVLIINNVTNAPIAKCVLRMDAKNVTMVIFSIKEVVKKPVLMGIILVWKKESVSDVKYRIA